MPVGRNAGPGTDHDDGNIIGGQPEMRVLLDMDRQQPIQFAARGQMTGCHALARFAVKIVADGRDGQMRFVRSDGKT